MAHHSPTVAKARSALGIHTRWYPEDADGLAERRRAFITEKLAAYLQRTLSDAPRLTDEQVNRLVTLVREAAR